MSESNELSELDIVNPYLSPLRQWVCTQLAVLLPDTTVIIASNNDKKLLFEEWTGQSQAKLEAAWRREGFEPPPEGKWAWTRKGGGPVTTSCEGLIGSLVRKILRAGKGAKKRDPLGTFNLPGCKPEGTGREPATTVGWHWYRDKTESLKPRAGDFFQVGTPRKPGRWEFAHVGVITSFFDGENPLWTTVEAGQGGPGTGYDFMKRKGPRPVNPVDPKHPNKQLMGWLDIDEFFEG